MPSGSCHIVMSFFSNNNVLIQLKTIINLYMLCVATKCHTRITSQYMHIHSYFWWNRVNVVSNSFSVHTVAKNNRFPLIQRLPAVGIQSLGSLRKVPATNRNKPNTGFVSWQLITFRFNRTLIPNSATSPSESFQVSRNATGLLWSECHPCKVGCACSCPWFQTTCWEYFFFTWYLQRNILEIYRSVHFSVHIYLGHFF